jgi:hypothetical protein
MLDFHFLFKISQLDIWWTGYHCSWYPLSMSHEIQLELLVGVSFLSMKLPLLTPPTPPKRKNPSFEEQPSLIPTLKMLLHLRQLLKTVQASQVLTIS